MLVGHVYKDCYPPVVGGIEKHIHAVRSGGGRQQHEVIVCARRPRGRVLKTPWGTERHVGELGRVLSAPLAPLMPVTLRKSPAGVFHFHMPNPTGELAAPAIGTRPYVATYHADIVRQAFAVPAYRRFVQRFLRSAAAVVVASEAVLNQSPFLQGVARARVIPYGIDTDNLSRTKVSVPEVVELRERYGYPFVLAVGRLVYYKGFDVLIEARTRGLDAPIVILGGGPLRSELQAKACALGFGSAVHFPGPVSERSLHAHYAAASAFVLPSVARAEAFGIATAEAQAFELPVVVTELGTGTTEAMRPGLTGLAVPPGDPSALAEALVKVLETNTSARLGAAGRRFVIDRLSARSMTSALDEVYEEVAA